MLSRLYLVSRQKVCNKIALMSTKDANPTSPSCAAQTTRHRPRSACKSNGSRRTNAYIKSPKSAGNSTWPSDNHCVVAFFVKTCNPLNLDKDIKPFGTVKRQHLQPHKNSFILKIEMSTSAEAKALWNAYRVNKIGEITAVKPGHELSLTPARKRSNGYNGTRNKCAYEAHWDEEKLNAAIKSGDVVTGPLTINAKFFRHAFVKDKEGLDIVIIDLNNRNRALNGDVVAVKINPEEEWLRGTESDADEPLEETTVSDLEKLKIDPPSNNNNVNGHGFKHTRKTGKVVGILDKTHHRIATGFLHVPDKGNDYMFHPVMTTFPYMKILKQEVEEKLREQDVTKVMYVAKIKQWSQQHLFPVGELCECIGEKGQIEAETKRILIDYEVDFSEFSELVEDCLPKDFPWSIPRLERAKRRDFTQECIFTIDPSTARDLDDALHCKKLDDGNYEVGVHIADVSYFVKPNTELDRVAGRRCTSVYMAQMVVPMLPRMLCEKLCSLNPGEDRLAFSAVWKVTEKGKILSEWFGRSVIRSCAQFSYDHAQSFIDDPDRDFASTPPEDNEFPAIDGGHSIAAVREKVLDLHKIAQNLRRQRVADGALRLDQVRLAYSLDAESGMPNGCFTYEYKKSNELIEEFMLLANMAVAHRLYKKFPNVAFLRSHSPPKEEGMRAVVSHCQAIGLPLDASSSGELARSLEQVCGDDELAACRKQALYLLAIKPQQLATYICAGAFDDPTVYRHYALNVPLYTHFTSPIRRYADVVVHRQLAASLGDKTDMENMQAGVEELQNQATLCNQKKMNSRMAQEASVDLFFNVLVNTSGPFDCRGMVMYVRDNGFDVLSIEYGVVKRVFLSELPILAYKLIERKTTGRELKVNVLMLKWPLPGRTAKPLGSANVNYDTAGPGLEQTIEVFALVSMCLAKKEPEDPRSIKAFIRSPAADRSDVSSDCQAPATPTEASPSGQSGLSVS